MNLQNDWLLWLQCYHGNKISFITLVFTCGIRFIRAKQTCKIACYGYNVTMATRKIIYCYDYNVIMATKKYFKTLIFICASRFVLAKQTWKIIGCYGYNVTMTTTKIIGCYDYNVTMAATKILYHFVIYLFFKVLLFKTNLQNNWLL